VLARFERLTLFETGMTNTRDVIPFPSYPKRAAFQIAVFKNRQIAEAVRLRNTPFLYLHFNE
jgi:hypothetical protein